MVRRRGTSVSSMDSHSSGPGLSSPSSPTPTYSHASIYQSLRMQLQLYSPYIKSSHCDDIQSPLAVFNNHDQVSGKVILDRTCYHSGKLSISIEGTFTYSSTSMNDEGDMVSESSRSSERRKHTFFSSSTVIPVSPEVDPALAINPRSAFRDAFMMRRPSATSLGFNVTAVDRPFPFSFELPRSCRPGEELPPSFTTPRESETPSNAVDVTYKIKVVWEADNAVDIPSVLEVPILLHSDHDFQSLDVSAQNPQSWLEMPLKSDRPMPFRCAVTLPTSVTFTRPSSISYFVVFATTPRSPDLTKEIAADATISVSLLRQINITEQAVPLPTPPHTPTSSTEELDSPKHKLFKRVARSGQSKIIRAVKSSIDARDLQDKPLPPLPNQTITEITTLQNSICIGFPKRPRHHLNDGGGHPSLESQKALPDGLHKSKIVLQKDMLPCIDWQGLSVKYYLDVSVLFGQDIHRARIPVRIL